MALTSHPIQETLFYFISRLKISSNIVTHYTPSAEQITYCHQILYIFIIIASLIVIPYIRSIIITPHHQCISLFIPASPHTQQTIFQFIRKPQFISIIVTHHPPSADENTIYFHILYVLNISAYPIRRPYIRSIIVTPHHQFISLSNYLLPPSQTHSRYYSS